MAMHSNFYPNDSKTQSYQQGRREKIRGPGMVLEPQVKQIQLIKAKIILSVKIYLILQLLELTVSNNFYYFKITNFFAVKFLFFIFINNYFLFSDDTLFYLCQVFNIQIYICINIYIQIDLTMIILLLVLAQPQGRGLRGLKPKGKNGSKRNNEKN